MKHFQNLVSNYFSFYQKKKKPDKNFTFSACLYWSLHTKFFFFHIQINKKKKKKVVHHSGRIPSCVPNRLEKKKFKKISRKKHNNASSSGEAASFLHQNKYSSRVRRLGPRSCLFYYTHIRGAMNAGTRNDPFLERKKKVNSETQSRF